MIREFSAYPEFSSARSAKPPQEFFRTDHEFAPPRGKRSRRRRLVSSLLAASLLGGALLGAGALSASQADDAPRSVAEETAPLIIEGKGATP